MNSPAPTSLLVAHRLALLPFVIGAALSGCSPSSPRAPAATGSSVGSTGVTTGSTNGTTGSTAGAGAGSSAGAVAGSSAGASGAANAGASGAAGSSGSLDGGLELDGGGLARDGSAAKDATVDAREDGASSLPVEAGPPLCDPTHGWGVPSGLVLTPTAAFARFSGVSANELTIAWTQADGTVYVADRAATSDPFGTGQPVPLGDTALAMDRVALSADGQSLLAITADRSAFVGFQRAGVGLAWEPLPSVQFANLTAMTAEGSATLSEPVVGADDATLFFLVTPTGGAPSLAQSIYDQLNRVWSPGLSFPNAELASTDATHRRRPTGGSSDGLTLFFYDEVAGNERAAWRSTTGATFDQFVDLPGLAEAAPSSSCATLYVVPPADASTSAIAFVQ